MNERSFHIQTLHQNVRDDESVILEEMRMGSEIKYVAKIRLNSEMEDSRVMRSISMISS